MPYKNTKIKTFGDLVKFIKDWGIEDYDMEIHDESGFEEYDITGCDVSYSSEHGTFYVKNTFKPSGGKQ